MDLSVNLLCEGMGLSELIYKDAVYALVQMLRLRVETCIWREKSEESGLRLSSGDTVRVINEYMDRCLLYTSPSPRDKRQSRMPSSA